MLSRSHELLLVYNNSRAVGAYRTLCPTVMRFWGICVLVVIGHGLPTVSRDKGANEWRKRNKGIVPRMLLRYDYSGIVVVSSCRSCAANMPWNAVRPDSYVSSLLAVLHQLYTGPNNTYSGAGLYCFTASTAEPVFDVR